MLNILRYLFKSEKHLKITIIAIVLLAVLALFYKYLIVVFFIVLISYMIYKAKEKKTVQPWNKNNNK